MYEIQNLEKISQVCIYKLNKIKTNYAGNVAMPKSNVYLYLLLILC